MFILYNKLSLIEKLKALSLPKKEFWVVAGSAMVLYGFRNETNDIDLGCTTFLADQLEQQGYPVFNCNDGTRRIVYSKEIELFENWLEGKVEIIYDLPVVSVSGLIEMKKKLGRKKDLEDLALIKIMRDRF